ncbi:MAG: Calx-beta domain-containing protein [Pseudomonadota bacterium]
MRNLILLFFPLCLVAGCGGGSSSSESQIPIDRSGPQISIDSVMVPEDGAAIFIVSLSPVSDRAVSVDFTTANGSAVSVQDFQASSGTVTIGAGQSDANIVVDLVSDRIDEDDETFRISLSNPVGGVLNEATGTATILDDDDPPTLSFGSPSQSFEGNNGITKIELPLLANSGKTISFDYLVVGAGATENEDFPSQSGMITIGPDQSRFVLAIDVFGDTIEESAEGIEVFFSNPENVVLPSNPARLTITDDDGPLTNVVFGQFDPQISADGSAIAAHNCVPFQACRATYFDRDNLTPVPLTNFEDLEPPRISDSGRFITFSSRDAQRITNVFFLDRTTDIIRRASVAQDGTEGNGFSEGVVLSENEAIAAFSSTATNLDPQTGLQADGFQVYSKNLATGVVELISRSSSGEIANQASFVDDISNDGRYVVFKSRSTNLGVDGVVTQAYLRDRLLGETRVISIPNGVPASSNVLEARITSNGDLVFFTTQSPQQGSSFFVYDADAQTVAPVALETLVQGTEIETPVASRNGRFVVFVADRILYAHDRQSGTTKQVSRARLPEFGDNVFFTAHRGSISDDGSWIAYGTTTSAAGAGTSFEFYVHIRGPFDWP